MISNNVVEDNVVYPLPDKDTRNKNISSANVSNINNDNDNNNKQTEKASWWINELDSLGIKKSKFNKNEPNFLQSLKDLSDNKKQDFIRDYKICYNYT